MDTNINVLDELNKGCDMGIEAIEMVLKKNSEHEFQDLLEEFHEKYVELSQDIKDLYHEYTDDEIHEVNQAERLMTWYGIMKDTVFDDSISKLADLMINGTNMGIIEGRKLLNHKMMDKKVHSICEKYIKMQEKYLEKLKKFL